MGEMSLSTDEEWQIGKKTKKKNYRTERERDLMNEQITRRDIL